MNYCTKLPGGLKLYQLQYVLTLLYLLAINTNIVTLYKRLQCKDQNGHSSCSNDCSVMRSQISIHFNGDHVITIILIKDQQLNLKYYMISFLKGLSVQPFQLHISIYYLMIIAFSSEIIIISKLVFTSSDGPKYLFGYLFASTFIYK